MLFCTPLVPLSPYPTCNQREGQRAEPFLFLQFHTSSNLSTVHSFSFSDLTIPIFYPIILSNHCQCGPPVYVSYNKGFCISLYQNKFSTFAECTRQLRLMHSALKHSVGWMVYLCLHMLHCSSSRTCHIAWIAWARGALWVLMNRLLGSSCRQKQPLGSSAPMRGGLPDSGGPSLHAKLCLRVKMCICARTCVHS